MKTTSYYPVLMTGDVAATAAFYVEHFRFKALFDSDWYVHLQSAEDRRVNLGIV
ncbi:MAG: glyoxalase, partial [Mesorhizobium sp.]